MEDPAIIDYTLDMPTSKIYPAPETVNEVNDVDPIGDEEAPPLLEHKRRAPAAVSLFGLWRYADRNDVCMLILAVFASLCKGLVNPVSVALFGQVFKSKESASTVLGYCAKAFASLAAITFVVTYISRSLWVLTAERQAKRISLLYLERTLNQDMTWFDTNQDESPITRLTSDIARVKNGLGENTGALLSAIMALVTSLGIAFYHTWKLTLVVLALMPLLIGAGYFIVRIEAITTQRSGDQFAQATTVAEQALAGIRTVYAFTFQKRFAGLYKEKLEEVCHTDSRKGIWSGFAMGLFMCVIFLIFAFAFWLGIKWVRDGTIQGSWAAVAVLAMMIAALSLMDFPELLSTIAAAQASARNIYHTVSNPGTTTGRGDSTDSGPEMAQATKIEGNIRFDRVFFSYPARSNIQVLNSMSAEIKAGQTVAFVGGSGSGKSTTIALLQRFYEPAAGSVYVDGTEIRKIDFGDLRRAIGVVGQEPVLFALTIKQNILLGLPPNTDIPPAQFISVCKMAACHDFVTKFPLGYDTPVTPGMLSGGQKQRIAIARALIKDPKILLLDEATSALDTKSERLVQKALDAASKGRTTIVIAHRLSTVRNADVIYVMQRGEVIEQGNHDELYARNGVYTQLVDKQKLSVAATEGKQGEDSPVQGKGAEMQEGSGYEANEEVRKMLMGPIIRMDSPDVIAKQTRLRLKEEKLRHKQETTNAGGKIVRRVLGLMRPDTCHIVNGTIAALIGGLVMPGFAVVTGLTLSKIATKENANFYILVMVVMAFLALFTRWGKVASFGKVDARCTMRLRSLVFRNLLSQEMGFFDTKSNAVGVLCYKLGAVAGVSHIITDVWGSIAELGMTALGGIMISAAFSTTMVGVLLIPAPLILFATYWQATSNSKFAEASKEALEQSTSVANESIRDVKTLKALQREGFAVERYDAFLAKPYALTKRNAFVDTFADALQGTAAMLTLAVGFFAGSMLTQHGKVDTKGVISTSLCMMTTMISMANSAAATHSFSKGKFAARTAFLLLDRQTAIDPEKDGHIAPEFHAGFRFKDLIFQYPTATEPTFRGQFSLEGVENTSLALVGPSGCGKSTVIGLLQRWYDASGGEASINNVPIRDYHLLNGLRPHQALVGQEPILFDMTIADNIAWGSENPVTLDNIIEAAKQADVHDFVAKLPQGYDTKVGAKGGHLSGGQKQRIAIARALIRKPKLLLLDEATSALDSASEVEVQKAIDKAAMGRTTVTIAHR
ncbi:hypothetical protein HDV00_003441 [Rhizophlyctis rosea]|nr:hypothetical protein HDV00_003441 [Rhizophlyctis rosea]